MIKDAIISDCGKYRYNLLRYWDTNKPYVMFVMLNPSIADARIDDSTITRCMKYALFWGYGGIVVCNLFAFRGAKPEDMLAAEDPIGSDNDHILSEQAQDAEIIVCAWGTDGSYLNRSKEVVKILKTSGTPLNFLKLTKSGEPGHPLYLKANLTPRIWVPRR